MISPDLGGKAIMFVAESNTILSPIYRGVLEGTLAEVDAGQEIPRQIAIFVYREHGHSPGNIAPVRLEPVARLWPAGNGQWVAHGLDPDATYTAISYDPTGEHAPAIQAGLTPSVD